MNKTDFQNVLLFGATGLVGSFVLQHLITDVTVAKIIVFVRKSIIVDSPKVEIVVADLKDFSEQSTYFKKATVLYFCVGTTISKAKTKVSFKAIDYTLPLNLARFASQKGINKFIALSSLGANANSNNFYLRTKGEMERDVAQYHFQKVAFLRPSFLVGPRKEFRLGEKMMIPIMKIFTPVLRGKLKKYRPIHAETIAKAMINISNNFDDKTIYESEELVFLGS